MSIARSALVASLTLACVCAQAQTTPPAAAAPNVVPHAAIMPPPPAPQIDVTFAAWDTNHDGALSLDEFRAGAAGLRTSMVDRRLHAQFASVDTDGSGAIDAAEYGKLLLVKRAGASAPPLSAFDANYDQRLNFAEYADLVRRLAPAPGRASAPAPSPVQK